MSGRDDGGPAFPRRLPQGEFPPDECLRIIEQHAGMSLRDYFAIHASEFDVLNALEDLGASAKAYRATASRSMPVSHRWKPCSPLRFADAMLKARKA